MSSRSSKVIAVADYLRANADLFNGMNQSRASRTIFRETGIRIAPETVRSLAAQIGVNLTTYNISKAKPGENGMTLSTKVKGLAEAVAKLYSTFDLEPTDTVKRILQESRNASTTSA